MSAPESQPLTSLPLGRIAALLETAYSPYLTEDPGVEADWRANWAAYDADVHAHPATVGAAGFATLLNGRSIGLMTWDPREAPDVIRIGHNCIVPEFQERGFGEWQLEAAMRHFADESVVRVRVTTGEGGFFAPAQRMYVTRGFREVGREWSDAPSRIRTIEYEWSADAEGTGR